MAVWLSFGRHAQTRVTQHVNLLQWSQIVGPDATDDVQAWLQNDLFFEDLEYADEWWLFDQVMLIADRNSAYLIDLSGDVTIKNEGLEGDIAIVMAEVAGVEGDVEFQLRESGTGRWQIESVSAPGAGGGRVTWPGQ